MIHGTAWCVKSSQTMSANHMEENKWMTWRLIWLVRQKVSNGYNEATIKGNNVWCKYCQNWNKGVFTSYVKEKSLVPFEALVWGIWKGSKIKADVLEGITMYTKTREKRWQVYDGYKELGLIFKEYHACICPPNLDFGDTLHAGSEIYSTTLEGLI